MDTGEEDLTEEEWAQIFRPGSTGGSGGPEQQAAYAPEDPGDFEDFEELPYDDDVELPGVRVLLLHAWCAPLAGTAAGVCSSQQSGMVPLQLMSLHLADPASLVAMSGIPDWFWAPVAGQPQAAGQRWGGALPGAAGGRARAAARPARGRDDARRRSGIRGAHAQDCGALRGAAPETLRVAGGLREGLTSPSGIISKFNK